MSCIAFIDYMENNNLMEKRVLVVATVPSTIGQFNMNNISILRKIGYAVDIAADFTDTSVWPVERTIKFKQDMAEMGIACWQLDFSRSPFKIGKHFKAYSEVLNLIKERNYSFIHTHTPIASAVVRMATHKTGTKVIYTAHGFHFFKGAPLRNWIAFYPFEKYLSKYTDVLVTITREDYSRALKKFRAKRIEYIPGVGVDRDKFSHSEKARIKIRKELGIADSQCMLLSVGELNDNKNHEIVIKAISGLEYVYVIVGKGVLKDKLEKKANSLGVSLKTVGYRNDVADFYSAADAYILPSKREGLNVSLMEAMSSGLPVACGNIRGNTDLIEDEDCLFSPDSIEEVKRAILTVVENKQRLARKNICRIMDFEKELVCEKTRHIYESLS